MSFFKKTNSLFLFSLSTAPNCSAAYYCHCSNPSVGLLDVYCLFYTLFYQKSDLRASKRQRKGLFLSVCVISEIIICESLIVTVTTLGLQLKKLTLNSISYVNSKIVYTFKIKYKKEVRTK